MSVKVINYNGPIKIKHNRGQYTAKSVQYWLIKDATFPGKNGGHQVQQAESYLTVIYCSLFTVQLIISLYINSHS